MSNSFFNKLGFLKSPAYMITWNAYVTPITFCSLSDDLKEAVYMQKNYLTMQGSQQEQMIVMDNPIVHDGFIMMAAFMQHGVTPVLPRKSQKWFPIQNLNTCLMLLNNPTDQEKYERKVVSDLYSSQGITEEEQLGRAREYNSWLNRRIEKATDGLFGYDLDK